MDVFLALLWNLQKGDFQVRTMPIVVRFNLIKRSVSCTISEQMLHESFNKWNLSTTRELSLKCAVLSRWQPKKCSLFFIDFIFWSMKFSLQRIFSRSSTWGCNKRLKNWASSRIPKGHFVQLQSRLKMKGKTEEKRTWKTWWVQGFVEVRVLDEKRCRLFF